MKISVIIPCYNSAGYLTNAVSSIIRQHITGTEIIVVDDKSSDNTISVAEQLKQTIENFIVIQQDANGGPAKARNAGLRQALGEYVCFLDADDAYSNGLFTAAIPILNEKPWIDAVEFPLKLIDCHREVSEHQKLAMERYLPSNIIVRRSVALALSGFPEGPAFRTKQAGEDVAFRRALREWANVFRLEGVFLEYTVKRSSHFDLFMDATEGKANSLNVEDTATIQKAIAQHLTGVHHQMRARAGISETLVLKCELGDRKFDFEVFANNWSKQLAIETLTGKTYPKIPFINNVKSVLDIGSNVGASVIFFASNYPSARVVGVEPARQPFVLLRRNVMNHANVRICNVGLHTVTAKDSIYLGAPDSVTNSVFRNALSSNSQEQVQFVAADAFTSSLGLDRPDIIKIDTEGCEIPIIDSMIDSFLNAKAIYIEYHSEEDRLKIDRILCNTHLLYYGKIAHPHRGELVYVHHNAFPAPDVRDRWKIAAINQNPAQGMKLARIQNDVSMVVDRALESTTKEKPSLLELERLVCGHRNASALQMVLHILQAIDGRYGGIDELAGAAYRADSVEDAAVIFATRFAAAFGRLLTEPDLEISLPMYELLSAQYRWIELIFSLSGFRTSDNFLSLIATQTGDGQFSFGGGNLLRFLVMRTMNSKFQVNFDHFWNANRPASAVAFLNYISSRYVFSRRAFEFRELLLEWIPPRLPEVKMGSVPLSRLQEVYMHCSYALTAKKHAIKRPLMEQMRQACLEQGVVEEIALSSVERGSRPTVVVVGDRFFKGSSNFRCFAPTVQSLRARFNTIGIMDPDPRASSVTDFFDESIALPRGDFFAAVRTAAATIVARKPVLIWYLGVGITPQVIALASLRLAPIQCASIGVNASTMSPMMDYFILPEDWVTSHECFSERVIPLPKAAIPFLRRPIIDVRRPPPDGKTRVAISATPMKLNPPLFDAIARISAGARPEVEFHFFIASGGFSRIPLQDIELERIVRDRIPRAIVHSYTSYERYMVRLANCDLFVSPFPHGGMNTIMDMFELHIPGICLDGAEPHSHADAAIFARINLPAELTTQSVDEYVAAAIRLIDDKEWRHHCVEIVRNADLDKAFFKGDPSLFCKAIENLIWPSANP